MKSGFTLVELSIVLVIIGLLIGGILVGQSLIESVRITKVIREAEQYQIIMDSFKSKFHYLPGDMPRGWLGAGCVNGTNNNCLGDGNGSIGENYNPYTGETCRFWTHLKLAGMLQYSLTSVNSSGGACYNGLDTPTSSYSKEAYWQFGRAGNGGATSSSLPGDYAAINNYFYLVGGTVANYCNGRYGNCTNTPAIIKPANAAAIDRKIDDGNPISGGVMVGNSQNSVLSQSPWAPQNRYCLASTNPYASPVDVASWSYYTSYSEDFHGCTLGIRAITNH